MYNLRLFDYPNGAQLRIYSSTVSSHEVTDNTETYIAKNPWGHDYVLVEKMKDKQDVDRERSLHSSVSRSLNSIYNISRSNVWDWFVTLTFNPELVDSFNYDECVSKLSKWLNNLKRVSPNMKYIVVPEKHISGRFHFHGLFAECNELTFTDSGKFTSNGDVIYNIGNYKLGFSTATAVKDNERVTKYICKYVTKELAESTLNKRRYWVSKNVNRIESQDVFLTMAEIDDLKTKLASCTIHAKQKKGLFQDVTYLELSPDTDFHKLLKE